MTVWGSQIKVVKNHCYINILMACLRICSDSEKKSCLASPPFTCFLPEEVKSFSQERKVCSITLRFAL